MCAAGGAAGAAAVIAQAIKASGVIVNVEPNEFFARIFCSGRTAHLWLLRREVSSARSTNT